MKAHESVWKCMIDKSEWKYMKVHESAWKCMIEKSEHHSSPGSNRSFEFPLDGDTSPVARGIPSHIRYKLTPDQSWHVSKSK